MHACFSLVSIDPPVRPAVPGRARSCPVQWRKPSRFRPPTLTRRSPRWHSLGQRTKLPQTTYSLSTPSPGDVRGADWARFGPPGASGYCIRIPLLSASVTPKCAWYPAKERKKSASRDAYSTMRNCRSTGAPGSAQFCPVWRRKPSRFPPPTLW